MNTEYEVITDYSLEHLQYTVSSKLKNGWQLAGGINTVLYVNNPDEYKNEAFDTILYSQAIFK